MNQSSCLGAVGEAALKLLELFVMLIRANLHPKLIRANLHPKFSD